MSVNAYAVIEVAKVASPVGSHGPALINLHWPNVWPGSYWGKGQGSWSGSSGIYHKQTMFPTETIQVLELWRLQIAINK